jgi:hypothetical protein
MTSYKIVTKDCRNNVCYIFVTQFWLKRLTEMTSLLDRNYWYQILSNFVSNLLDSFARRLN